MGLGYLLLIGFGAWVALKYYTADATLTIRKKNQYIAPPGVGRYPGMAVTSRKQQTLAYRSQNSCQSTQPGVSAAFGPYENQPTRIKLEI